MTKKRYIAYYQGDKIVSVHDKMNNNELVNIVQLIDRLNEQEETIQNQKEYILLLEQKLEENGIILEPKDFD